MSLVPKYTAAAELVSAAGGALSIGAATEEIATQLVPFLRGDPGGGGALVAGPGFQIVGNELRHAISTLTRG